MSVQFKLLRLIDQKPDLVKYLKRIVDYIEHGCMEKYHDPQLCSLGFEYSDVQVPAWVLKMLFENDVLCITYKSNKSTMYRICDDDVLNAVKSIINSTVIEESEGEGIKLPNDFLETVEGFDDLKNVIKRSILADEPVHILLVGPPATAKSLMLMEIERLPGSVFVTMGTASKAGIRDVLIENRPRFLIIDELDKINNPNDISILLTLMESGKVIVTLHKLRYEVEMKTWVFAAANSTRGIPPELLDRFMVFHIQPYSPEEYINVTKNVLVKRYNVQEDLALYIAQKIAQYSTSVREAVRYTRLCKDKECVDDVFKTAIKYRPRSPKSSREVSFT